MSADILRCQCGKEVRVVRLNAKLLGLGHVTNPANGHHPVRLSRAAADRSLKGSEDSQPQRRVSDPTQRTIATRGASDGLIPDRKRRSGRSSSGIASKSPRQGRSQRVPSPAPASASGLGPR